MKIRFVGVLIAFLTLLTVLPAGANQKRSKVVFIGIDGMSWKVLGPLIKRGEAPAFKTLLSKGASMPEFETMNSTSSPVVWTSVATGRLPNDHGITAFSEKLETGQIIPVSGNSRKTKAIWEVANEYGVTTGVIGWWATWPAEKVNGYLISDHANPAFSEFLFQDKRYWTADPKQLTKQLSDFYPLNLARILHPYWVDKAHFPYEDLQRRSHLNPEQMKLLRDAPWNERKTYSLFKTFYLIDQPLFAISRELVKRRPVDLQLIYLRGPDGVQHYAWDLVEPEKYQVPPENLDRDRGLIDGIYRYLDSFLAEVLKDLPSDATLIVASDHGAEPSPGATGNPRKDRPGAHSVTAKGVLFIYGKNVKPGFKIEKATPLDLAPTMTWLCQLPLSKQFAGRILKEAFVQEYVKNMPASSIASYGIRKTKKSKESPQDPEMLEMLRSLGYIQ